VRVIDAGSRTVNYVTLKDKRYVDRDSGTLPFGFGTTISGDLRQMAARIAGELGRKWRETDAVLVAGGRAEELAKELKQYFPQTETFTNPLFANAIGYYRIGRKLL
jgi:plasmid segregation protein ParM